MAATCFLSLHGVLDNDRDFPPLGDLMRIMLDRLGEPTRAALRGLEALPRRAHWACTDRPARVSPPVRPLLPAGRLLCFATANEVLDLVMLTASVLQDMLGVSAAQACQVAALERWPLHSCGAAAAVAAFVSQSKAQDSSTWRVTTLLLGAMQWAGEAPWGTGWLSTAGSWLLGPTPRLFLVAHLAGLNSVFYVSS